MGINKTKNGNIITNKKLIVKMKHIKQFESYRIERRREEIINLDSSR